MGNRRMHFVKLAVVIGVGFLLSRSQLAMAEMKEPESCMKCHEDQVGTFTDSHHKKAWEQNDETNKNSCSTCHGDGEAHIQNKGHTHMPIYFKGKEMEAKKANETCLKCHSKTKELAYWQAGKHGQNDLSCGSCHNLHVGTKTSVKPGPEKCFTCHKDVARDATKSSHHPLVEGKVSCSDCHNPHGTLNRKMLVTENNNQLCYKCHNDKRGPYLWQHSPVEENCLTCHDSHGSRNPKLLVERVPNLCQDCHMQAHAPTAYDDKVGFSGGIAGASNKFVGRSCINCHVMIHGSLAPSDISATSARNKTHTYTSGQYFLR